MSLHNLCKKVVAQYPTSPLQDSKTQNDFMPTLTNLQP